jgi:hypothetical protein
VATIVTGHFVVGRPIAWMDFIEHHHRRVDRLHERLLFPQVRPHPRSSAPRLLELNTISEAVNHSVELDIVLQNALEKVMGWQADCGWIYLNENDELVLGTTKPLRAPFSSPTSGAPTRRSSGSGGRRSSGG